MNIQRLITSVILAAACTVYMSSCLNPIGFSPEAFKISAVVEGEISIDNINSAEVQFVNHTKSMDITKVEIYRSRVQDDPSLGLPLDARLLGGPHAGTKESILLRPIGQNFNNSIQTNGYNFVISYDKASHPEQITDAELQQLDIRPGKTSIVFGRAFDSALVGTDREFLPRGKTTIHMFRNSNGQIVLDTLDPDPDNSDYFDYITNVKVEGGGLGSINLGDIEIGVKINDPITITFSPEVIQAVNDLHIKLSDMTNAINSITGAINNQTTTLGEIMMSMNGGTLPNYSVLSVINKTGLNIQGVDFTQVRTHNNTTVDAGFASTTITKYDQEPVVLKNGTWKASVYFSDGTTSTKTISIPQNKEFYLYKNVQGTYIASTKLENAMIEYGYVAIKNNSSSEIKNIYFVKKYGYGETTTSDMTTKGYLQNLGPRGTGSSIGLPHIEKVELGNYTLFATLTDGSILFDYNSTTGKDFVVGLPTGSDTSGILNMVEITQKEVNAATKPKITYQVYANGGPPVLNTDNAYTTTKLTVAFSAAPIYPTYVKLQGASTLSAMNPTANNTIYEIDVTAAGTETIIIQTNTIDIDPTPHQVVVYLKDTPPQPLFIPVTNIEILNSMDFIKGTGKTINSSVIPENATNKEITWTIGTADVVNFDIMHHYGLGPSYDLNTTTTPQFRVNTSWGYDYFYIAAIVKNGLAEGTRNPSPNSLTSIVYDVNGNKVTITMQALVYDPVKDYVEIFRYNQYTPPQIPQYIYMKFVNKDDGYNPAMTRLIAYRLKSDVDIGTSTDVANGNGGPAGFYIYRTNGGLLTGETASISNGVPEVMTMRAPTKWDIASQPVTVENKNAVDLPVYKVNVETSQVEAINGDTTKTSNSDGRIYIYESCILEFDRPLNRAAGTHYFNPNKSEVNIKFDGTGNWLLAWVGSNQYQTTDTWKAGGPGQQTPTSLTGNSSRLWTRGGNQHGDRYIWFLLPPTLRKMKSGDSITVYARQWGIQY